MQARSEHLYVTVPVVRPTRDIKCPDANAEACCRSLQYHRRSDVRQALADYRDASSVVKLHPSHRSQHDLALVQKATTGGFGD